LRASYFTPAAARAAMDAPPDCKLAAIYEKWQAVRSQVSASKLGGAAFNGAPLPLLRAVDEFREASGAGRLLSCWFDCGDGRVTGFGLALQLGRGVAYVRYRASGSGACGMDAQLRAAMGESRARRVRALYRRWAAFGLPGEAWLYGEAGAGRGVDVWPGESGTSPGKAIA
jgi:hypothetical protein